MYHPPVQSPIHPPYEKAVELKKKGGLAKLSSSSSSSNPSSSISLGGSGGGSGGGGDNDAASPEDVVAKLTIKDVEEISSVLGNSDDETPSSSS